MEAGADTAGLAEEREWLKKIAGTNTQDQAQVLRYYVSGFFEPEFAEFILPFAITANVGEKWEIGRGVGWTGLSETEGDTPTVLVIGLKKWDKQQTIVICEYVRYCAGFCEMEATRAWDNFYKDLYASMCT